MSKITLWRITVKNIKAIQAVEKIIESGYRHYAYEQEKKVLRELLLEGQDVDILIERYLEPCRVLLGPAPLRAIKNGLICLLTTVSRSAIGYGADSDYCFALSDYYINEVEKRESLDQLRVLCREIIESYRELIREKSYLQGSADIRNALKYIHQHLYGPVRVKDVAEYIGMSESNLSKKFKKETGVSMSEYIENEKLKEAYSMLELGEMTVFEVSECLGFCNSSYFAKRFKTRYGCLPSRV